MFNGSVQIRFRSVAFHGLPPELDGYRIAHISDLHLHRMTPALRESQERLSELNYDTLLCTGDIGDHPDKVEQTVHLCREFFEPLAKKGPIIASLGNHDAPRLAETLFEAGVPIRVLLNSAIPINHDGREIWFAGVDQSIGNRGSIPKSLEDVPASAPVVMLSHYPSTVYRVRDNRVGLVVSGHTHGGQIRLPFLGCVWAQDEIPNHMARGLHAVNGRILHVCAGVGCSWIVPIRFLCPPEMGLLTLRPAIPAKGHGRSYDRTEVAA